MSNFFTPIEVATEKKKHVEQYEVQKYNSDPFQPASVRIESLSDHRKKIMQWLKSLPISSRVQMLMYTNKQFVCLLLAMFQRVQDRNNLHYEFSILHDSIHGYGLADDRLIRRPDSHLLQAEKRLIQSICVIHRYTQFDSVAIDENLVSDVDGLFELFDIIQNGVSHELSSSNFAKYQSEDSPLLFYDSQELSGCTKTFSSWFVEIIKKSLSIKYFKAMREREEEDHLKNKGKEFRKFWKMLSPQEKEQCFSHSFSKNICHIVGGYRENIRVDDHTFPKIMYSSQQQIDDFKVHILHNNGEVLLRNLMFSHLSGATQSLAVYKYQLMIQIEDMISKRQNDPPTSKKKLTKTSSTSKEINGGQKLQNEAESSSFKKQKEEEKSSENTEQVTDEKDLEININGKKLSKKMKKKTNNNLEKNYEKEQSQSPEIEILKQMSEATNDQEQLQEEAGSLRKKAELEIQEKFIEEELDKIYKEIQQQSNAWSKHREIGINRMYDILKRYSLSFKVFGSHVCGLGLPSSDIDICVDPTIVNYFIVSFRPYRDKIIMGLEFLRDIFRQIPWGSNFNIISTAAVPVLTFEIDLSIPYGDPRDPVFNLTRKKDVKVKVDLTIQFYVNMVKDVNLHLGFESTLLIKEWIGEEGLLSEAILLVKHLLVRNGLNKSFSGGMSSFALVLLIYAFFLRVKNGGLNECSFLRQFCIFVCNFNEKEVEINLSQEGDPFSLKKVKENKLIILNPLNKRNLTDNSYKFIQIKSLMQQLAKVLSPNLEISHKEIKRRLRGFFF